MVNKLDINETLIGAEETGEVLRGFYIFKNYRQEYFFVSDAVRKTQIVADAILDYVFGAARFSRIKADTNTYKYYINAIQPATIYFKESPRIGKYADIIGNNFTYSVAESDETTLYVVEGLV